MRLKKRYCITSLLLAGLVLSYGLSAKVKLFPQVNDLKQIVDQIATETVTPQQILLIFDIDDTLLESENFVSSVKWYNWQRGRKVYTPNGVRIKIKPEQQYACIFSALGTLFEMGMTRPTQADTAQIINQLKPYNLLYLTARTTIYRAPTERELKNNKLLINQKHLVEDGKILHFMLNDGHREAKVTYEKGIAMSSGLNKGKVLKALLNKMNKSYPIIYFVDDSQKNIDQMAQQWESSDSLIKLFHYTRVSKSISEQEIASSDQAKVDFEHFIATAFPQRMQLFKKGQCH